MTRQGAIEEGGPVAGEAGRGAGAPGRGKAARLGSALPCQPHLGRGLYERSRPPTPPETRPAGAHLLGADVAFHVFAPAGLGQRRQEQQQQQREQEQEQAPEGGDDEPRGPPQEEQGAHGGRLHPLPNGRLRQPGSAPCALPFKETESPPSLPPLPKSCAFAMDMFPCAEMGALREDGWMDGGGGDTYPAI